MLTTRIITAVVLGGGVTAAVLLLPTFVAVAVLAVLWTAGAWEWAGLARLETRRNPFGDRNCIRRMKMNNKALIHLAVGAFGTFIFVIAIIFVSGTAGRVMSLMANIGVLFYLQQQMKKDIEGFKATGINVENANQFKTN